MHLFRIKISNEPVALFIYATCFSDGVVIDLHIDSARIVGSCTSSRVTLVVPVDLHNPSVRSSECKHVKACIGVG